MANKNTLLKQFLKPDEKLLFSKALDQVFLCEKKHFNTFTDFLDPVKGEMFSKVIKDNFDIAVTSFGGCEGCERKMLKFSQNSEIGDFPIDMAEILFSKSAKLTHRDFLGAVLGLGISRDKVGDIFVFEKRAVVFLSSEISFFVSGGLEKVGNTSVEAGIIEDDYMLAPMLNYTPKEIFPQSLRLDAVISAGFNLSRSESLSVIQAEKAQINWAKAQGPSKNIEEGDNITVRGFGRLLVKEISVGKKGNFIVKIDKLG